jgi:Xaa-Pro aminopeptidase
MSLGRYQEYKDVFQVNIDSGEKKKGRIFVYAVEKDGMASAHDQDRAVAQKTALELIDKFSEAKSEDKDLIKKNISASRSDKFALLESLMLKDNLSSVLASSPINIQELAPLPWEELKDGFLALYHNQKAFLLCPEPVENPLLTKKGDYDTLRDALDELIGDASLGVEEKNLDIGRVSEIGWDKVKNATDLFRTWREHSTLSDLPYYVIVGQATRYAMEKAVAFAGEAITAKQKITEKDVEEKFLELVNEFKLKYNCSLFDFKRYFVVLHAGTRTPYASLSSDYLLNAEMNSLKLDAGILILQNGILRGCSDMARSLVLTEEGKKVYLLTERLMLESAIPAAKPGNTGSDVYWAGVSPLVEIEEEIKKWGMLPPAASIKDSYNRDIGHIMAKQEPATIGLVKAETNRRLQAGMIGAVEYQWPYKKHALGIEDLYLVTDKRGIVISR